MSICGSLSIYLSINLSIYLSIYPSICLSIYLSIYTPIYVPIYLSNKPISLSVSLLKSSSGYLIFLVCVQLTLAADIFQPKIFQSKCIKSHYHNSFINARSSRSYNKDAYHFISLFLSRDNPL